jgi:hypothetical protein
MVRPVLVSLVAALCTFGVACSGGDGAAQDTAEAAAPLLDASAPNEAAGEVLPEAAAAPGAPNLDASAADGPTADARGDAPSTACRTHPNEPAGLAPRWPTNEMGTLPLSSESQVDMFGYAFAPGQGATLSIQDDPTSPGCDSKVLRVLYPKTMPSGGAAPSRFIAGNDFGMGGAKTKLYTSVFVYIVNNWNNGGNVGTKFFFFRSPVDGQINHYLPLTDGVTAPFDTGIFLQGGGAPGGAADDRETSGQFVPLGAWFHLELYVVANTPGQNDGVGQLWIDGALVVDLKNIPYFASGQTNAWEYLFVDPTFGGGLHTPPYDEYFQVDDWYTSVGP